MSESEIGHRERIVRLEEARLHHERRLSVLEEGIASLSDVAHRSFDELRRIKWVILGMGMGLASAWLVIKNIQAIHNWIIG